MLLKKKKISKYIIDDIEISSDSHRENSAEENPDGKNSDEGYSDDESSDEKVFDEKNKFSKHIKKLIKHFLYFFFFYI